MALFSQRKGFRPITKAIQRESLDEELRNGLWNALCTHLWDLWSPPQYVSEQDGLSRRIESIVSAIWVGYFKLPIDTQPKFHPKRQDSAYRVLRKHILTSEWWECLDLIEFIVKTVPSEFRPAIIGSVNRQFEVESAAYRIVGDEIVEISDENEIQAIEAALQDSPITCQAHFRKALDLLSDRKQPDYHNSIKESISAVESACRAVSGKPKATLGDCLKIIKTNRPLHRAFEDALSKLYGYTSDEGGIRHSLTEAGKPPTFADAKFMLVTCSAFVNYLWTLAAEENIPVNEES